MKSKNTENIKRNYLLFGIAFGLLFPLMSIFADYFFISKPEFFSFASILSNNPIHYIILLAPIVLGLVFHKIGIEKYNYVKDSRNEILEKIDRLAESEERFRKLSEVTLEGVIITNKGIITDCNSAIEKLSEYSKEELIGKSATEIVTEESAKILIYNIINGITKPYQITHITKSGKHIPIEVVGRTIEYRGETMRVASVKDITERLETERQIENIQENLRETTSNVPGVLYRVIINDKNEIKFIYISEKCYEFYGHTSEEILNDSSLLFKYGHPDDVPRRNQSMIESISKVQPWYYEGRIIMPDGKLKWLKTVATIKLLENGDKYAYGFVSDITEQMIVREKREKINNELITLSKLECFYNGLLDDSYERVIESIVSVLDINKTSIWFKNESNDLECKFTRNINSEISELNKKYINYDEIKLYLDYLVNKSYIILSQIENENLSDAQINILRKFCNKNDLNRTFHFPLRFRNETIGLICVEFKNDLTFLQEDDIQYFTSLNDYIVISLNSYEKIQTEEKLQESEKTLETAQKIAKLGSWIQDLETNELNWSDNIYEMMELDDFDEKTFENLLSKVHQDDVGIIQEAIGNVFIDGKDFEIEYRMILNDNSIKHIYSKVKVEKDIIDNPIKLFGISQDVTERVLQEQALKESEQFNKQLIAELPYPVFVNINEKIIFANKALLELTEFDEVETYNKNMVSFVHPDYKDRVITNSKNRNEGKKVGDYEIQIISKSGILKDVIISGRTIKYENQSATLAVLNDITERKQIENERIANQEIDNAINFFSTSLVLSNTIDEVLWEIARNCISKLGFDDCVLYLMDENNEYLLQKVSIKKEIFSSNTIFNPLKIKLGDGIVGHVAKSGKSEVINDTYLDSRYKVDDYHYFSEISVPIISEGKVIGIIDSEHPERNFFKPKHLKILTTIASLCANKIEKIKSQEIKEQLSKELIEQLRENEKLQTKVNRELEEKVLERTLEIEKQKKNITDSIEYAKRIQMAMMPDHQLLSNIFDESFILLKPRDVVSGDFYWFSQSEEYVFLAVADCTGHGVPGALMSMIGNSLLNEIILQNEFVEPSKILFELNKGVVKALRQDFTDNKDGMDISLMVYNKKSNEIQFSGARNQMYLLIDNEIITLDAVKHSIGSGAKYSRTEKIFKTYSYNLTSSTIFYMCTDGYQDQLGGQNRKKFKKSKLKEIMLDFSELNLDIQKQQFEEAINYWRGEEDQVDDILLIGGKIKI